MNIFILDSDPEKSAILQNNVHSYKMPTESLQLLCFAFPENSAPYNNSRKHPHFRHPASIFTRNSKENFQWLLEHFKAQLSEYKVRYKRDHAAAQHLKWIELNCRTISFPNTGLTQFARCFSSFKEQLDREEPDAVKAYRKFYVLDKAEFSRWPSLEKIPAWWPEKSLAFVDKNFKNGEYTKR